MTVPASDGLFRSEALEYFATRDRHGQLVEVSSAVWMTVAYRTFLALVALGVVAAFVIHVDGEPLLFVLLPALGHLVEIVVHG